MKPSNKLARTALASLAMCSALAAVKSSLAEDWTMWGRTGLRQMISPEKNPPTEWNIEEKKNIKWVADLGSKSYANPVVSEGVVYVGTNNEAQRDPKFTADAGVLMAFRESDGKFLWQRISPKLPTGRVNDWPGEGLCSTAYTEPGRLWYCTNRCEVVCLDTSPGAPQQPHVLWSVDMMKTLGVFPHNMTACAIASHGDLIYVITGNGVDDSHKHVVAPQAPAIVCFNKNTGQVVWTDNSPKDNVLHGQWASPAIVPNVNGKTLVIAPLGDGWVYAYNHSDGKIVWKFDTNNKDTVYPTTRNEIIATPVVVGNLLYLANGQDPEHGEGPGHLWCVDITKQGDVSRELPNPDAPQPKGEDQLLNQGPPPKKGIPNPNSAVVWDFERLDPSDKTAINRVRSDKRMNRTISTVLVYNDCAYAADFSGFFHCLDAKTGKHLWTYDAESAIWGSPMAADGKIYLGTEDGTVLIFEASRDSAKVIGKMEMESAVYSSPVYANGTLYIMTRDKLFAIGQKKE